MKVAQISKPGGDFELVEREIPQPEAGQVRVKVEACGICHSDVMVKDGVWPGLRYPRVPGHEVAGRVDAVGDHVANWRQGDRSASDGTVATISFVTNAGAAISPCVRIAKSPVLILTVATPNT